MTATKRVLSGRSSEWADESHDGVIIPVEKYVHPADGPINHNFAGLHGDSDGKYIIEYSGMQSGDGIVDFSVKPNGIATEQKGAEHWTSTAGITGVITYTEMRLVRLGSFDGNPVSGFAHFWPKSGMPRIMKTFFADYDVGIFYEAHAASIWLNTDIVINSLLISSDNSFKAGFLLELFRMAL